MSRTELRPFSDTSFLLTCDSMGSTELRESCDSLAAKHSGFAHFAIQSISDAIFDGARDPRIEWELCYRSEFGSLEAYLREHRYVPRWIAGSIELNIPCCLLGHMGHAGGSGVASIFYGSTEDSVGFRLISELFGWSLVEPERGVP